MTAFPLRLGDCATSPAGHVTATRTPPRHTTPAIPLSFAGPQKFKVIAQNSASATTSTSPNRRRRQFLIQHNICRNSVRHPVKMAQEVSDIKKVRISSLFSFVSPNWLTLCKTVHRDLPAKGCLLYVANSQLTRTMRLGQG